MASPRLTEPIPARGERSIHGACSISGDINPDAVRSELERILASPAFRNSKRYSSLLKHVVERALEGRGDDLKERNIGVDVFGRPADYDTNADHVVRSVAREVRRGLAQYYMETGNDDEVRIELLPGSYVPQFRCPTEPRPVAIIEPPTPARAWWQLRLRSGFLVAAGLVVVLLASALTVRALSPTRTFERFWSPFLLAPNPALLCVGGGGQSTVSSEALQAMTLSEFEHQPFRRMHMSDALALSAVASMLQANGKAYRIANRSGATSFRDLQSGPFVLIGGMNNEWTLRLTKGLRFGFESQPNGARVIDRQNPGNSDWTVQFNTPIAQFNRDYAIVSRLRDPQTEQPVVIVAGIGSWGTLAAGEFVSHPEHLKKLESLAPRGWEQKNLQVVISTDVIRGSSGPPAVRSAHFW
jgi:hypothetical protein